MDVSVCDGRYTGDASKGDCEMYQTTACLAKNCLHPGFPWHAATETLQTAGGRPGKARSGACAGPWGTAVSERTVPLAPARSVRLRAPPFLGSRDRQAAGTHGCSDTELPHNVAGRVEDEATRGSVHGDLGVTSQTLAWVGVGRGPAFTAMYPSSPLPPLEPGP